MKKSNTGLFRVVLSSMFLALALVLPFLTGQLQSIGNMLCPMHLPVLLCGFFCGPSYAVVVGFLAPLVRFVLFGMPTLVPNGVAMCFELSAYGLVSGMLYRLLPKSKKNIYISLISAMIVGRIVWGIAELIMFGLEGSQFGWAIFFSHAFTKAIPGIILQLILVPILVIVLTKQFPRLED